MCADVSFSLLNRITLKFKCALCNVDAHFDRPGKKAGRARAGYELYSNSDDRRQGNYGREHTNADGTCRTLVEDWIAKQRMFVFLFSLSFDHQLIALSSAPAVVVLHGFDNAILFCVCVCVCLAEWKEQWLNFDFTRLVQLHRVQSKGQTGRTENKEVASACI